ncbi:MAG: ABC transporter ATP-binding protein, partial [Stackebrandtia sp.]
MSTVELRGFTWRHAGRRKAALHNVNLRITHGERVLLLGPSGSGKSTLLAAVAGVLAADSGEQTGQVLIDGIDARDRRARVGIVFQDPRSQLVMARAGDDVAFGLENRGVPHEEIWPRVDKALSTVGFRYGLDRPVETLSGGEQQRLVLAGALVAEPSVLLLDEPTANLDPSGAAAMRDGLRQALDHRDTTVILVEHRVTPVLPLVDRVIALDTDGTILADGDPDTIFADHGDTLAAQGAWVPGQPPMDQRPGPGAGAALLTAEDLGLWYSTADQPALTGANLEIRAAELLAVTGANGSGKSTLALLLGGLARPRTGAVRAGPELNRRSRRPVHRWRATELATRIGSVFQDPEQQFITPRVRDELKPRTGRPIAPERIDDLLE